MEQAKAYVKKGYLTSFDTNGNKPSADLSNMEYQSLLQRCKSTAQVALAKEGKKSSEQQNFEGLGFQYNYTGPSNTWDLARTFRLLPFETDDGVQDNFERKGVTKNFWPASKGGKSKSGKKTFQRCSKWFNCGKEGQDCTCPAVSNGKVRFGSGVNFAYKNTIDKKAPPRPPGSPWPAGGNGFIELGQWRIGLVDAKNFCLSHKNGNTPVCFDSEGKKFTSFCPKGTFVHRKGSHCCKTNSDKDGNKLTWGSMSCKNNNYVACPGGRCGALSQPDTNLWAKKGSKKATNIQKGDGFIQFGDTWRLGAINGYYMSISYRKNASAPAVTAAVWTSGGSEHLGPRSDLSAWSKKLLNFNTHNVKFTRDKRVLALGNKHNWRIGDFDGAHFSLSAGSITVNVFKSDGSIKSGRWQCRWRCRWHPRRDFNLAGKTIPGYLHPGEGCLSQCGHKNGPCEFCGEGYGSCCRSDTPHPSCTDAKTKFNAGVVGRHTCVPSVPPTPYDLPCTASEFDYKRTKGDKTKNQCQCQLCGPPPTHAPTAAPTATVACFEKVAKPKVTVTQPFGGEPVLTLAECKQKCGDGTWASCVGFSRTKIADSIAAKCRWTTSTNHLAVPGANDNEFVYKKIPCNNRMSLSRSRLGEASKSRRPSAAMLRTASELWLARVERKATEASVAERSTVKANAKQAAYLARLAGKLRLAERQDGDQELVSLDAADRHELAELDSKGRLKHA